MEVTVKRREMPMVMWAWLCGFVLLHGLDIAISTFCVSAGADEVGVLYGSGLTVQMVAINILVAFIVGALLVQYKVGVKVHGWLVIDTGRWFRWLIAGKAVIVCYVMAVYMMAMLILYYKMNGGL